MYVHALHKQSYLENGKLSRLLTFKVVLNELFASTKLHTYTSSYQVLDVSWVWPSGVPALSHSRAAEVLH